MKKITILLVILLLNSITIIAQVAISKNAALLKASKFEDKRFDDFKKTTTIFVLNNLYEKKQYEEMLKSCWTITPFEVVELKDFKYENYISDKYSFCMMYGYTSISQNVERTRFLIHFYLLDMDLIDKKIKKLKNNDYYDFLIDKKKNLAYIELIPNAEIYNFTDSKFISGVRMPSFKTSYNYGYFSKEKSDFESEISKKIYNEKVFHNYNLGILKNNFQEVNRLLLAKKFYSFNEELSTSEIKQLKNKVLYLPEYLKKEYFTKPIEYKDYSDEKMKKILSAYPYKIEFISENELETKMLNNEEFYYLNFGYRLRFFQVINSKTGNVIYKVYPNGMMKANLKESDFKDLTKAIKK